MSRIPRLTPETMATDQRALYDSIVGGPRGQGPQHFSLTAADGSLNGPFNALLLSPRLGEAIQGVGAAVRYETSFTARSREIAILIVAAHWRSEFELRAHEAVGRSVGLTDDELSVLRSGDIPELADPVELALARLTHAMVSGDVGDELWASVAGLINTTVMFELTSLVGYYALLALQLRIFRVESQ